MENQIIRGTVETTKVDADFPENTLSGAIFEVYADVTTTGSSTLTSTSWRVKWLSPRAASIS